MTDVKEELMEKSSRDNRKSKKCRQIGGIYNG
jgi:hypothetical protein